MIRQPPQLEGYRALTFDLDGTLYPSLPGLEAQFDASLKATAMRVTRCSAADVEHMLRIMRSRDRHAVQGLARSSGTDPSMLLEEIYFRLDLDGVQENPVLASILSALASHVRILVLTNSSRGHAERVLRHLGLHDLSIRIYGMEEAQYHLKPDPFVYRNFLSSQALASSEVLYFDDALGNIAAARSVGLSTVHVVRSPACAGTADPWPSTTDPAWTSDDIEGFLWRMLTANSSTAPFLALTGDGTEVESMGRCDSGVQRPWMEKQ